MVPFHTYMGNTNLNQWSIKIMERDHKDGKGGLGRSLVKEWEGTMNNALDACIKFSKSKNKSMCLGKES